MKKPDIKTKKAPVARELSLCIKTFYIVVGCFTIDSYLDLIST